MNSPSNMSKKLKFISTDYIKLDYDAVKKYAVGRKKMNLARHYYNKSLTAFTPSKFSVSSKSPTISHEKLLYPSFITSYRVLQKNKLEYKKMVTTLSLIESKSLSEIHDLVINRKKKLDYLRLRTKHAVQSDCIFIFMLDAERNEKLLTMSKQNYKIMSPALNELSTLTTLPMPYSCGECSISGWKPEGREGAILITVPVHKEGGKWIPERTYMFGGLGRDLYSEISYIKYDPMENEYVWMYMYSGENKRKRYGHTINVYDGKLVVLGGAKMYNSDVKRRECLNEVLVYSPTQNTWKEIIPVGAYFEPRRYHCTCLLGTFLIVHGGLNDKDAILSNLLSLNISAISEKGTELDKQYRWLIVRTENQGLPATAYHTCNLVLDSEKYKLSKLMTIFSMPDLKYTHQKIAYEGIYYFGGRNEQGASNDLYILRVGRKPLEWVKPEIKTKKPPPRYGHSAQFFPDKSILVIFGGRNDENFAVSGTVCMNDIWVFSAETLEWKEWISKEYIDKWPSARYLHCSAVLGKSILIFGGLSDDNYCRAKLYEIDMMGKRERLKRMSRISSEENIYSELPDMSEINQRKKSKKSIISAIQGFNRNIMNQVHNFRKKK